MEVDDAGAGGLAMVFKIPAIEFDELGRFDAGSCSSSAHRRIRPPIDACRTGCGGYLSRQIIYVVMAHGRA
jgi:hypothetical protein